MDCEKKHNCLKGIHPSQIPGKCYSCGLAMLKQVPINIIFDGPPGKDSPRFVEVELDNGESIKIGEWIQQGNYWALRITELPTNKENHENTT